MKDPQIPEEVLDGPFAFSTPPCERPGEREIVFCQDVCFLDNVDPETTVMRLSTGSIFFQTGWYLHGKEAMHRAQIMVGRRVQEALALLRPLVPGHHIALEAGHIWPTKLKTLQYVCGVDLVIVTDEQTEKRVREAWPDWENIVLHGLGLDAERQAAEELAELKLRSEAVIRADIREAMGEPAN